MSNLTSWEWIAITNQTGSLKKHLLTNYLMAFLILGIIWWILAALINKPALPTPIPAILAFYHQLQQGLLVHIWVSLYRIGLSLLAALLLGVPLGIILGISQRLDRLFAPLIYITFPIPKIVFLPVLLVLFGYGDGSKVFLIALIIFYQILVAARDAAKNINQGMLLSVESLGAKKRHIYYHVYLLGTLPEIFTALRIALSTSIAVLFIAEAYATQAGLGYFIMDAMGRFDYNRMFAGIIGMGILGLGLYVLIDMAEKLLCPWNKQR